VSIAKDYINLTTPFMEAMAIMGTHHAIWGHNFSMSAFFDRATSAITCIERYRAKLTSSDMEFFKERRQSLFKQWGINVHRGINASRDEKGKFCFNKDRDSKESDNVDENTSQT